MSRPVRLDKQHDNRNNFSFKIMDRIEKWVFRYAHIILPLVLILGLLLFIAFCYTICGASATDSGLTYNQMENII